MLGLCIFYTFHIYTRSIWNDSSIMAKRLRVYVCFVSTQFILHLGYLSLPDESTDTETEYRSVRYVDFGMGVNNMRCKSSLYVLHLVLRSTRYADKNPQIDNDQDHLHSTHKWNIQTNASKECELSAYRG